jgi:hypothetical protein
MSRSRILLAVLVVLPATALLSLKTSVTESVAEECRAKPGASAPQGTRWRYRVSRADHRHCWFLNHESARVHSLARERASDSGSESRTTESGPTAEGESAAETAAAIPMRPASVRTIPVRATTAPASAEPAPGGPSVVEDETTAHFSARWPNSSKFWDLDVRDFAAVPSSYAETYSAANTDEQTSLVWPGTEPTRARTPLDLLGGVLWRTIFQIGVLLAALLAIAGAAFKLLPRLRQNHCLNAEGTADERPAQRTAGRELPDRNSIGEIQQDRHVARPVTLTDPARDLKKSLAELMGDLRRAKTSQHASRSFAPHKLGGSFQNRPSTRDLLPPIDGWGQTRVEATAPANKAPTWKAPTWKAPTWKAPTWIAPARRHVLSTELPETPLASAPSLVPA